MVYAGNMFNMPHAAYHGRNRYDKSSKWSKNMESRGAPLMEFENYLKANRLVPVDKLNYYLYWVDKFMKGHNYLLEKIG